MEIKRLLEVRDFRSVAGQSREDSTTKKEVKTYRACAGLSPRFHPVFGWTPAL
jgi:hypothetical protein